MTDVFDDAVIDVSETGHVGGIKYGVSSSDEHPRVAIRAGDAYIYFRPDALQDMADHVDRVHGLTDETDPRERGWGWNPDEDIIMSNRPDTTGIVAADELGKVMDDRAESVLLTTEYLREALDVAENFHDGKAMWVSVQRDRPLVFTPKDNDTNLAASVAPRTFPDGDGVSPTEEL